MPLLTLTILNPVWSVCDNPLLIKKILYLDKKKWMSKNWYKVSCTTTNEEIKKLVREQFDIPAKCGGYLKTLSKRFPEYKFEVKSWTRKEEESYRKPIHNGSELLTGFIDRVQKYCATINVDCTVTGATEFPPDNDPYLEGVTPREDQLRLVQNAIRKQRGFLVSPTGSGKTLIAAWIFSAYPSRKKLFLCHTISLLTQTYKEFTQLGFKCSMVSGNSKDISGDIVIATIQSFVKMKECYKQFEVVIADEVHHLSTFKGEWAEVLRSLYCPIRIGLTATPSKNQEAIMAVEGYLGPKIDDLSLIEGIKRDILVKPKLRVIKVPSIKLHSKTYDKVYNEGIINNRLRNHLIMSTAKECAEEGKTVLIFVSMIEHGNNLVNMGKLINFEALFIKGETGGDLREEVKAALKEKSIKCVIATTIWKEGVNIPSLDVVIPAGGGKSEIATLQAVGRGLRTFEGKEQLLIIDFFDQSSHYFVDHFGERMSIYCDLGVYK